MARSFESEYDVFVSFCEEDTLTSFTGHLFAAFERKEIRAYRGEEGGSELLKEIETSNIAVVVFSKNYATSHLCLDELVKIMECKRLFNQSVIPVFYDVSPSEVRKQKGNLGEALLNGPEDKVNSWKVALTGAANLAGLDLKPCRTRNSTRRWTSHVQTICLKSQKTILGGSGAHWSTIESD